MIKGEARLADKDRLARIKRQQDGGKQEEPAGAMAIQPDSGLTADPGLQYH